METHTTTWLKVFAPATVANLGPGFDILGLALHEPGDIIEARLRHQPGVKITDIRYADLRDAGRLSLNPDYNTAGVAAAKVLQHLQRRKIADPQTGVELILHKNLPLGSGLGSSGASAVAAAWAVNLLLGAPLPKSDPALILACTEAEATRSGFHADNVAPAMLGGIVLIRSYQPLEVISVAVPEKLVCVVVAPRYNLPTREARAAIPQTVPFREAVVPQCANVAGLIAGLCAGDISLVGRAIDDRIVEPARAHLIPGFADVKQAALAAGALGCSISGAGPSVFAITDDLSHGQQIGQTMAEGFARHGLTECKIYVSPVNHEGAKQL